MPAHRRHRSRPGPRPLRTIVVALSAVVALGATVAVGWSVLGEPSTPPAAVPVSARVGGPVAAVAVHDRAREVLRRWDARRVAAWSAGDAEALGALYTRGAPAGARDVAMLERWNARGVRMAGWTTQVLALDVVRSEPARLVVDVTDRVVAAIATRGARRTRLPVDEASRRRIELRRGAGGAWRVVSVRAG